MIRFFIILSGMFLLSGELTAHELDLRKLPAYFRPGWADPAAAFHPESWKKITEWETLAARDLLPQSSPFHFFQNRAEDFSVLFSLAPGINQEDESHGFLFARIGDNFEIYLNGKKIHSDIYPLNDGKITVHAIQTNLLLRAPAETYRSGENLLLIHFRGDPASPFVGLTYSDPNRAGLVTRLEELRYIQPVYLGITFFFLFLAAFHFILYWKHSLAKYNLYFALSILFQAAYYLTVETDPPFIDGLDLIRANRISLFLAAFSFAFFVESVVGKISHASWIFATLCTTGIILAFFPNAWYLSAAETVFDGAELMIGIWLFFWRIPRFLYADYRHRLRHPQERKFRKLNAFRQTMTGTLAGNLCIGLFMIIGFLFFDIFSLQIYNIERHTTIYAVCVLVGGLSISLNNHFQMVINQGAIYRGLFESLPEFALVFDGNRILFANERAREMIPEGPGEPGIESFADGSFKETLRAAQKTTLSGECEFKYMNGRVCPVEFTAQPFIYEGNPAVQVIAMDSSARKAAEKQAEEARRLEEMEKLRVFSLEKEMAVLKERESIQADLHDHLGGSLTDISLQLRRWKTDSIQERSIEDIESRVLEASANLRNLLHYSEDFKLFLNDFEKGFRMMLVRRYSNAGRSVQISIDNRRDRTLDDARWQVFKNGFFSICREIATNDLKYGDGMSEWNVRIESEQLHLEILSQTGYSPRSSGNGKVTLRKRTEELNGIMTEVQEGKSYRLQIHFPLSPADETQPMS